MNLLYLIPTLGSLALVGIIGYEIALMIRDRNKKIHTAEINLQ